MPAERITLPAGLRRRRDDRQWFLVTDPHDISRSPRVILLTGPSGAGKSRLSARSGLPVMRLDDFYKEAGDPTLPMLPHGTGVDWDSARSWDAEAAVAAVQELCVKGRTTVPLYDISLSARVGTETLDLDGARLFIAEGIFAADIVARCRELDLLADAICLRGRPTTTFRRRLLRDLREGRKSPPFLLRRGWRLMRSEGAIVQRHRALGAHPCGRDEAAERIRLLSAAGEARTAR
ncbi:uridine kinase [Streptomyces sp. WMMB 714]|nr:uridine kinase [Streptomyces sp. WMMB 714]